MTKDGKILEELVQIRNTYKSEHMKFTSKATIIFDNVTYNNWVKIRRLIKKLNCGVLMQPEGNLDTINLVSHPRQYDITLREAFQACKKNNLPVGCSLTFMPKKLDWMNK